MRYYSAGTGRFLRPDPAEEGLNLYVYCDNDPLNYVDPFGLTHQHIKFVGEGHQNEVDYSVDAGFNWMEYRMECWEYLANGGTPYRYDLSPEEQYRKMQAEWRACQQWSGVDLASIFGAILGNSGSVIGYIWTSPNTAIGIALGLLSLDLPEMRGGELYFNSRGGFMGLLEFMGWAKGIALGHTIITYGKNYGSDIWTYQHEMGHVRQYDLLGPAFLPTYLVNWGLSGFDYNNMSMERAANRYANEHTQ